MTNLRNQTIRPEERDYLITSVVKDLRYISNKWDSSVSFDEIRRGSNVLRTLLGDGSLRRVWKLCDYTFEMRVRSYSLPGSIQHVNDQKNIVAAFALGGKRAGVQFASMLAG